VTENVLGVGGAFVVRQVTCGQIAFRSLVLNPFLSMFSRFFSNFANNLKILKKIFVVSISYPLSSPSRNVEIIHTNCNPSIGGLRYFPKCPVNHD